MRCNTTASKATARQQLRHARDISTNAWFGGREPRGFDHGALWKQTEDGGPVAIDLDPGVYDPRKERHVEGPPGTETAQDVAPYDTVATAHAKKARTVRATTSGGEVRQ